MTTKELTQRLLDLETILLKLTEKKPSLLRRWWNRFKPSILPFVFGALIGFVFPLLPVRAPILPLAHQAALGGAAIPFPSGSPSPKTSSMPPKNWKAESNDSLLTNISEPPLPVSPPADTGQAASTKLSRLPIRRTP